MFLGAAALGWRKASDVPAHRRAASVGTLQRPRTMTTSGPRTEEFKVSGANLKAKLKAIIRQGTVRRIVIKNGQGRQLLDIPLTAGLVGVALLPFWAAIGGILALASDYTIVVEHSEPTSITKK